MNTEMGLGFSSGPFSTLACAIWMRTSGESAELLPRQKRTLAVHQKGKKRLGRDSNLEES